MILTQDITTSDTCIQVSDIENKTFDCQGYTITGPWYGEGIHSIGWKNTTIKDCAFSLFDTGILLDNGNSITLIGVSTSNCLSQGIALINVANSAVFNFSSDTDPNGIYLENSSFITMANISTSHRLRGIAGNYVSNTTIVNFRSNGGERGIDFSYSINISIEDFKIQNIK